MGGAGGLGGSTGPVVSSNDYRTESRTTALAFGTSASIPYGDVPRCYLPARGFKRVRAGGWGAFDLGPVIERDEQCMDDLEAQRQHERDMLELELARLRQQAENDRIAMERMRAVMECDRCQAK